MNPPVNVATVPQLSPFRYPGGKTWLVPTTRLWLRSLDTPSLLVEPFAGGASVGLTAVVDGLVGKVLLVELDEDVAAVWRAILDDAECLAQAIIDFPMTRDNVCAVLATEAHELIGRAFKTILRNRVLHGGILAPGSRMVRRGESGRGVASRWYPTTLAQRIRRIASCRERIRFLQTDAMTLLRETVWAEGTVFFVDPPYSGTGKRAGRRLYVHYQIDHTELFSILADLQRPFLLTYSADQEIEQVAEHHGFQVRRIAMKNTHHAILSELLISHDLSFLDTAGGK